MNLYDIFTYENINSACYKCIKTSRWKESTQRYQANMLLNNLNLQQDILNKKYKVLPTNDFWISERGKLRFIEAPHIRDRIVQKVLCEQVLLPQLRKCLIYDNYASLKQRGTHFARKRLDIMLNNYIKRNGDNGYVLKIDIKKYFDNIDHDILKNLLLNKLKVDKDIYDLICYIIDNSSKTEKGLNLGSEVPQILAVFYLYRLDNYIKSVKGIKYYGRYMDDMFIISNSKEELKNLLIEIKEQLSYLKLNINESKTQIFNLSNGFTFLQIKYRICNSKIIKIPSRSKITRERRKLKKYKKLLDNKKIELFDVHNAYKSWKFGIIKDCNRCYYSVHKMDNLFNSLFESLPPKTKRSRDEIINNYFIKEINLFYETYSKNRF